MWATRTFLVVGTYLASSNSRLAGTPAIVVSRSIAVVPILLALPRLPALPAALPALAALEPPSTLQALLMTFASSALSADLPTPRAPYTMMSALPPASSTAWAASSCKPAPLYVLTACTLEHDGPILSKRERR
eukprot:jgi/Chrpa1/12577/Chrysochromulina_OHIO_Genome00006812-RA